MFCATNLLEILSNLFSSGFDFESITRINSDLQIYTLISVFVFLFLLKDLNQVRWHIEFYTDENKAVMHRLTSEALQ